MTPGDRLRAVANLVDGERAKQHGNYRELHEDVAKVWEVRLGFSVTPADVAWCMCALKLVRGCHGRANADDPADLLGYGAIWSELQD